MPDAGAPVVIQFGSRAGAYTALALFSTMFGMVACSVWFAMRQRVPAARRARAIVSGLLFLVPLTLVYWTSIGGFREAEVRDGRLILRYLYPWGTQIPLRDVATVRARWAFKMSWRLHVTTTDGTHYESATTNRDTVEAAAARLRALDGRIRALLEHVDVVPR